MRLGGLSQEGFSLPVVLDALCRLCDAAAEGYATSILVFDRTGTRVRDAIGPGLPRGTIELLMDQPVTFATQVPAPCRSSAILASNGDVLGILSLHRRDVDNLAPLPPFTPQLTHIAAAAIERTQADKARQRREALHATAEHLSSTGSFSWRPSTNEISWSGEVYCILAVETSLPPSIELMASRVHPEDLALFHEMVDRERRGSRFEYEFRLRVPDAPPRHVRVVAQENPEDDGQPEYRGVIQDVTTHRLCEATLDKVRSEFARLARVTSLGALTASITHEVIQPLTGIITNASTSLRMLATDPPDVEGARKTAQRTVRDGQRAYEVIARMRALIVKRAAPRESVNLNELAREAAALLWSELQRAGAILRVELAEYLPSTVGDGVQLQQVIINLLLNASEAMRGIEDRPRSLVLRTWRDQSNACLSVQDSGVGLRDQDRDRLFEAFYTTKPDGIGIGLSVSRSIIEGQNGRLWADPNVGPGATFSFAIPGNGVEG